MTFPGMAPSDAVLADRVGQLTAAHPWMDPTISASLASQPTSDSAMHQIASGIQDAVSSVWDGISHVFDDPVLHKTHSTALTVHQYLTGSIGPVPVADPDLQHIQRQLQKQGYGVGLPADGAWNPTWNDQYNAYSVARADRALAGDTAGAVSVKKVSHSIWDSLMPTNIIDQAIGYVRAVPGMVNNAVSDLAGDVTTLGATLVNLGSDVGSELGGLHPLHPKDDIYRAFQTGAGVGSALHGFTGTSTTKDEQLDRMRGIRAGVADVANIVSLAPIIGQEATAAKVAGTTLFKGGVDSAAASRGPGFLARNVMGGRTAEQQAAILAGTEADLRTGLFNPQWIRNRPFLGQVGPRVARTADQSGWYYASRSFLASPYKQPLVRAVGGYYQRTAAVNVAITALGAVNGQTSPLAHDLRTTTVLDTVDAHLGRVAAIPLFGGHLHPSINWLAVMLHGPLPGPGGGLSRELGDRVAETHEATIEALNRSGGLGAMIRATKRFDPSVKGVDDLVAIAGSPERLSKWMRIQLAAATEGHGVHRSLNEHDLEFPNPPAADAAGDQKVTLWNDPVAHQAAMADLFHAHNAPEFQQRIEANILAQGGLRRSLGQFMEADSLLTDHILGGGGQTIVGPKGLALARGAADAFDFGEGTTLTRRATTLTRREWNASIAQHAGSVARALDRAQVRVDKDITMFTDQRDVAAGHLRLLEQGDPEKADLSRQVRSAAARLRQANQRKATLDEALRTGSLRPVIRLLDDPAGRMDAYLLPEMQLLEGQWKKLTHLLGQAHPTGHVYQSFDEALSDAANSDRLFTRVNGEPRGLPRGYDQPALQDLLTSHPAPVGLARKDTLLQEDANKQIAEFTKSVGGDPAEVAATVERVKDWLFTHFGINDLTLSVFGNNEKGLKKLLTIAEERAGKLAARAYPTFDTLRNPVLKARHDTLVQKLDGLGYQLAVGTHIGHSYDGTLPTVHQIDEVIAARKRRLGEGLGLLVTGVSPQTKGAFARTRIMERWQGYADDHPTIFGPRHTVASAFAWVQKVNEQEAKLPVASKLLLEATRPFGLHGKQLSLLERTQEKGKALQTYERQMARKFNPADLPRTIKHGPQKGNGVVDILTKERTLEDGTYWPGMERQHANQLYYLMLRGLNDQPKYIMGLDQVNTWARAGFGMARLAGTRPMQRLPGQDWLGHLATLPNDMIRLRNYLRFDLSFLFNFRRIAKTTAKAALEDVKIPFNPLAKLVRSGEWDAAAKYARTIYGDSKDAERFDEGQRYFYQQSPWGLFNPDHYKTYFAWAKHKEGLTDQQVKEALHKVFSYGSAKTGKVTGLERSFNVVWFPLSFEKSLWRNTGGYMLDHPAQALAASLAVDEYSKYNEHEKIHNWLRDHAPAAEYANKLNAFSHGLSPGEFGGVNRTLLNMFLPQNWGAGTTKANLERLLPVWHDFGQLVHSLADQAYIVKNGALDGLDRGIRLVTGAKAGEFHPYPNWHLGPIPLHGGPPITPTAQGYAAASKKSQLVTSLAPTLRWNVEHPHDQLLWPTGRGLPPNVEGHPINRTTLGKLMTVWFPAYNPNDAAQFAIAAQQKAETQILRIGDDRQRALWQDFTDKAATYARKIYAEQFNQADLVAVDRAFRLTAIDLAETYPGFTEFYRLNFKRVFGPITEVTTLE